MEILFCIPGGGTSSLMYMGWQKLLKDEFTIIPLEIPGRGRLREMERASSLEEIAEGMARQVCEQANGRSYGIFGYCYGGILAYEICRILAEEGKCLPEDLYLCGTSAPFEEISVTLPLSRKEHRQDLKGYAESFFSGVSYCKYGGNGAALREIYGSSFSEVRCGTDIGHYSGGSESGEAGGRREAAGLYSIVCQ